MLRDPRDNLFSGVHLSTEIPCHTLWRYVTYRGGGLRASNYEGSRKLRNAGTRSSPGRTRSGSRGSRPRI